MGFAVGGMSASTSNWINMLPGNIRGNLITKTEKRWCCLTSDTRIVTKSLLRFHSLRAFGTDTFGKLMLCSTESNAKRRITSHYIQAHIVLGLRKENPKRGGWVDCSLWTLIILPSRNWPQWLFLSQRRMELHAFASTIRDWRRWRFRTHTKLHAGTNLLPCLVIQRYLRCWKPLAGNGREWLARNKEITRISRLITVCSPSLACLLG